MPPKRNVPDAFGDDDAANTSTESASKRSRTGSSFAQNIVNAAGPAVTPASKAPQPLPSTSSATVNVSSVQAQLAAAKARIQAQLAAAQAKGALPSASGSATPVRPPTAGAVAPPSTSTASAGALPPRPQPGSAPAARPLTGGSISDIAKQVAEAKRIALERAKQQAQARAGIATPVPATPKSADPQPPQPINNEKPSGIHPLLMGGDSAAIQSQLRSKAPKFSSVSANARASASAAAAAASSSSTGKGLHPALSGAPTTSGGVNPYLVQTQSLAPDERPRQRKMHKPLQFNKAGKFLREAEEARRQAQMEELKKRIEESARKAGLVEGVGVEEKMLRKPEPPEAEWWDHALLTEPRYEVLALEAVEGASSDLKGKAKQVEGRVGVRVVKGALLEGEGSAIDPYIQHPIPIPAPMDKIKVAPKGVMLTKKEMKKMRRQRRAAELEDKRDRIKMGLLPPDPPKVKLSNLMRVLGSEAVKDPTKVEARVRREIAARRQQHERTNEERKLTPEQRREKLAQKMAEEEAKGLHCLVFKIRHLASPSHKFKVRANALQNGLTGIAVFHPSFALVVVEGSAKSLKAYRHLMLERINWQDPGRPRDGGEEASSSNPPGGFGTDANSVSVGGEGATDLSTIDWSTNRCQLLFQGPVRERGVGKGFVARQAPTDAIAKEVLGKRMESYWDLAKRATEETMED